MKIKRFVAKDIRLAMRMVKEELGADAVIMSNKSVEEGVEIVAARDFDEQAIHSKLNTLPSNKTSKKDKKIELLDFEAEKDKLHIVSSPRKVAADGSIPKRPVHRNINQYVGYSEKVDLAGHIKQKKNTQNQRTDVKQATSIKQTKKLLQQQRKNQGDISSQFMQEMRDEIKQLKTVFNAKLTEISNHQPERKQPLRISLLNRLTDRGFSKKLSSKIANRFENFKSLDHAFEKAKQTLTQVLPVLDDRLIDEGGIVALVGPTGVGKTTTIAKLAANYILEHGASQVALITIDSYRIAAYEQLNTYGKLLNVPVKRAENADELREHITSFKDKKLILIDTAGMGQRDMRLAEQIQILQQENMSVRTSLVMSATTQYQALNEIIKTFKVFNPESAILTKLDETVMLGTSISVITEHQLPLSFITNGQQVPEDIHYPDAKKLIKQCTTGIDEENNYTNENRYNEWAAESYA